MDRKIDIEVFKNTLSEMAELVFDYQDSFGSESLTYMLLQHARDDLLAVTEILDLPEYL